jgi:hypothetical protein
VAVFRDPTFWLIVIIIIAGTCTLLGRKRRQAIAARVLILSGGGRAVPLDYSELEQWSWVGFERRTKLRHGER